MRTSSQRATTRGRRPTRLATALLALTVTVSLAGCGSDHNAANSPPPTASPTTAVQHGLPRSTPTWIKVPSIDASSSLVELGLNPDNTIQVPPVNQPLQAGWYKYSPTPGEIGPAVILGHIDGDHQEGIFWHLREVKAGDQIQIGRADGSVATFIVDRVQEVPKKTFSSNDVYGNTSNAQVRLITCGGAFDASARSYLDNIIVYATLRA